MVLSGHQSMMLSEWMLDEFFPLLQMPQWGGLQLLIGPVSLKSQCFQCACAPSSVLSFLQPEEQLATLHWRWLIRLSIEGGRGIQNATCCAYFPHGREGTVTIRKAEESASPRLGKSNAENMSKRYNYLGWPNPLTPQTTPATTSMLLAPAAILLWFRSYN